MWVVQCVCVHMHWTSHVYLHTYVHPIHKQQDVISYLAASPYALIITNHTTCLIIELGQHNTHSLFMMPKLMRRCYPAIHLSLISPSAFFVPIAHSHQIYSTIVNQFSCVCVYVWIMKDDETHDDSETHTHSTDWPVEMHCECKRRTERYEHFRKPQFSSYRCDKLKRVFASFRLITIQIQTHTHSRGTLCETH